MTRPKIIQMFGRSSAGSSCDDRWKIRAARQDMPGISKINVHSFVETSPEVGYIVAPPVAANHANANSQIRFLHFSIQQRELVTRQSLSR